MNNTRFFVFYDDDYADNGGLGTKSFPTLEEATDFVFERMKSARSENPVYQVVEGVELQMRKVQVVEKIEFTRPPGR